MPFHSSFGLDGVTIRYAGSPALDGVTVVAEPGTVTAVVGGDGAGKSTLLRCLAGVLAPSAGEVRRPPRRLIGYQPERGGTYPDLTVAQNLAFSASLYGTGHEGERERTQSMLERTGLAGARERLAGDLSGGMRQKLAVVRAMLHQPSLLVLDEPSTGIDPASRRDLWWLVARAAAEGAAVVLSTTYLDEAGRADTVLALEAGRVAADRLPAAPAGRAGDRGGRAARPAPAGAVLAEARRVTRRFGAAAAVDGVDLAVGAGEIVGMLGANGAGKTTLVRLLLGLLPASAGEVRLFGGPPSRRSRARVGYVPQGLGLYDDLTPAQNARFTAAVFGTRPAALPEALRPYGGSVVGRLPRGVQRRLAFALAVAHRPDLLVLDEPTSGVDPTARGELWATIREAAAGGAGVLVTTHHMDEAGECDRLVVMVGGRVVAAGDEAELVRDAHVVVVETAARAAAFTALDAAGLTAVLARSGLRVVDAREEAVRVALAGLDCRLSRAPATLEERFLQLAA